MNRFSKVICKSSFFTLVFMSITCSLFGYTTVKASQVDSYNLYQPGTQTKIAEICTSIDFVFILDLSEDGYKKEPAGIGVNFLKWMIGVLGYEDLLRCPDVKHSVAVIGLGEQLVDRPELLVLPQTPINPTDVKDPKGWANQRNDPNGMYKFTTKIYGSREYKSAFLKAAEYLSASSGQKKAIFLIDGNGGAPCTMSKLCASYQIEPYVKELKQLVSEKLPFVPNVGPYINVYAYPMETLTNNRSVEQIQKDKTILSSAWRDIAADHKGMVYEIGKEYDYATKIMEFFIDQSAAQNTSQTASSIKVLNGCKSIYIDPAVNQIAYYVYKETAQSKFTLQFNDGEKEYKFNGEPLQDLPLEIIEPLPNSQVVGQAKAGEFYILNHPVAGEWKIVDNCQVKVYFWDLQKDLQIKQIEPAEPLKQYDENNSESDAKKPARLKFTLFDENSEKPIVQHPKYPIVITGDVTYPDGKTIKKLTFMFDKASKNFVSQEVLPVRLDGKYTWKITIQVPKAEILRISQPGNLTTENIARQVVQEGSYEVKKVIPFKLVFTKPAPDTNKITLHKLPSLDNPMGVFQVLPFPVQVEIVDMNNNAIPGEFLLLSNPNQTIEATLTHIETKESQKVYMNNQIDDTSLFKADIGEQLSQTGDYILTIKFVGVIDEEKYRQSGELAEKDSIITKQLVREDNLITTPSLWATFYLTLTGLVLLFTAIFRYTHTNHVTGSLVFSAPILNQPIHEVNLGKNHLRETKTNIANHQPTLPILYALKEIKAKKSSEPKKVDISFLYNNGRPSTNRVIDEGGSFLDEVGMYVKYKE